MLRLRECVVSYIISLSSTSAVSPLLRLLSAAAAPVSPNPSSFAVEDYLIHTCGLTRPQALKASTKISHLKSPAKPNAVLAFLAGLGLSGADVAAECGLSACDIANLEHLQAMVTCAEGIGVPRGSGMFRQALHATAFQNPEKIAAKVDHLKNTFKWLHAEAGIAVSKVPILLRRSKDTLQRTSEFLISKAGLEPARIAHRPILLTYSLEGRLRPRYYVLKFVKANGLLDHDRSYFSAVDMTENVFVEKFVRPHIEAAPHLAEDYAAACRGEVPTRFIFA
ncbi:hypothetical protein TRIUR3_25397 [Triticum urartu]|uniref:Uncharacterized protein n=1 Tax=Triticum urartu TaxID=4572 RepID=M7ZUD7_TRIUA|nr:hypothetical protein TRIUR3_25397 [Triticum urartu]